jgi:FAD/FMN-containing dehydrogenase
MNNLLRTLIHSRVRHFSTEGVRSIHPEFLKQVACTLPHIEINTNKYELESHGKGESYHPSAPPSAILIPTSNEDVANIVQLCNEYHVPLIPYGTGTSVEGHVSALRPGSISLDMKEFQFIDDCTSLDDPCITVGAGVTRLTLNDRLRHTGMQFMVDPGADASIGGMVGAYFTLYCQNNPQLFYFFSFSYKQKSISLLFTINNFLKIK